MTLVRGDRRASARRLGVVGVPGALILLGLAQIGLGPVAARAAHPTPDPVVHPIKLGFADPRYSSHDPATREVWFDRGEESGAQWARISVSWRAVARTRPADPADPASPEYRFGGPDAAIREAAERGQPILLTFSIAPAWAEGAGRPAPAAARSGTWRPDPAALADFASALATRYSGRFPDPRRPGADLPRVSRFEVWNEPNLAANLTPQWVGDREAAADHYRQMVDAVYPAIHAVQPGAVVVAGSLASIGSVQPGGLESVGPLDFLRRLLCVDGGAGDAKRATACGRVVRLDALSHHPIGIRTSPDQPAGGDDAGIAEMGDVTEMLRAAERAGTVPGGRHPVWATELWWYSNSPRPDHAFPALRRQARFIEEGLYMLWRQHVKLAVMYQVGDQPGNPFQTGVTFSDGRPKPSQTAFRFPLVGERISDRLVRVWGRTAAGGVVRIVAARRDGPWSVRRVLRAPPGGAFRTTIRLEGPGSIRATVAGERSLIWKVRPQGRG